MLRRWNLPQNTPIMDIAFHTTECIDADAPVWKAWRLIKDKALKVLPVMSGGRVVGLVSDRDIIQISGYNGGQSMPVKEAMSLNPQVMSQGATLYDVLQAMLATQQEAVVLVDDTDKVSGLFTWSSGLKALLNKLQQA